VFENYVFFLPSDRKNAKKIRNKAMHTRIEPTFPTYTLLERPAGTSYNFVIYMCSECRRRQHQGVEIFRPSGVEVFVIHNGKFAVAF
jgi:uncharacterized protein YlaI